MTLLEMLGIALPIIQAPMAGVSSPALAYDAGKALNAAAKAGHEAGYGAQWAGQGAPLARTLPAVELVAVLAQELAVDASSASHRARPRSRG